MDQASNLRNIIIKKNKYDVNNELQEGPRIICVTSGKGGVGKSNFTINLAISLRKKNKKVVVIDADLGLANIEILLGINPRYGLGDLVNENLSIEDIMVDGPLGIKLISGGAGIQDMADLPIYKLNRILNGISLLKNHCDFIIIDTGAGISKTVTSFAMASTEIVVITTPDPTSIADAYAIIKIIFRENIEKEISLLVNRAENKPEADMTYKKINSVSQRFLTRDINYLGFIPYDKSVTKSVKLQTPFYLEYPNSSASLNIDNIANKILNEKSDNSTFNGFLKRFVSIFSNGGRA